jgi:hypothetical protein
VYKTKVGFDGKSTKLKVHLVACGFQQRARINYNNFFALVVKWNTIHNVLSMVASNNQNTLHLDVKIAFLSGNFKNHFTFSFPKDSTTQIHKTKFVDC